MNHRSRGHFAALLSILVWGTTFISTKILLVDFTPVEILFFRFVIGMLVLTVAYPKRLKGTDKKQELTFMAAGLTGVTLYFLLENIALTFTTASNVGIILSAAPFFTGLLAKLTGGGEKPGREFYIGFLAAMIGIFLISYNGSAVLSLNPMGDLLALLAAAVWAVYSMLSKRIVEFGHHTILTTRRVFLYGLVFMLPTLIPFHFRLDLARFGEPQNLFNIFFLGLGASALCFVTWNFAVKTLGVVKTSVYIYAGPVITVITSAIVLHEPITWLSVLGMLLTLAGLFLSEKRAIIASRER